MKQVGCVCRQPGFDDEDKADLARQCRIKAADNFLATLSRGGSFTPQAGASEAVLVDCLRRAGRGNEAFAIIDRALGGSTPDLLQQILKFQRTLIERGDTARHTVEEAAREK